MHFNYIYTSLFIAYQYRIILSKIALFVLLKENHNVCKKVGILIIALLLITSPAIAEEAISNNSEVATPTIPQGMNNLTNIMSDLLTEKDSTPAIDVNNETEESDKALDETNTQNNPSSNTPTLASVNEKIDEQDTKIDEQDKKIDEQDKKIDEQVASLEAKLNDLESSLDMTKADKERYLVQYLIFNKT